MSLELSISTLAGALGTVVLDAGTSLEDAKAAIELQLGVPAIGMRLVYGLTELRDPHALDELQKALIPAGDTEKAQAATKALDAARQKQVSAKSKLLKAAEAVAQARAALEAAEASHKEAQDQIPTSEPVELVLIRRSEEQVKWLQTLQSMRWTQMHCWLLQAPEEVRADAELMLAAVSVSGGALQYASSELRADRGFVLKALARCRSGNAFGHVAAELRGDSEIARAAVVKNASAFRFVSEELQNDRKFVLAVASEYGAVLEHVAERFRQDREVVLAAVSSHGPSMRFASDELRIDRQVRTTAARSRNGGA